MIDIFELKKSSILEDENIKNYFNTKKTNSLIDYRKIYEYKFLDKYNYNDVLPLLSNIIPSNLYESVIIKA